MVLKNDLLNLNTRVKINNIEWMAWFFVKEDVFLGIKEISCSQQFKIILKKINYERSVK